MFDENGKLLRLSLDVDLSPSMTCLVLGCWVMSRLSRWPSRQPSSPRTVAFNEVAEAKHQKNVKEKQKKLSSNQESHMKHSFRKKACHE